MDQKPIYQGQITLLRERHQKRVVKYLNHAVGDPLSLPVIVRQHTWHDKPCSCMPCKVHGVGTHHPVPQPPDPCTKGVQETTYTGSKTVSYTCRETQVRGMTAHFPSPQLKGHIPGMKDHKSYMPWKLQGGEDAHTWKE
jgi:hypothetical protein